MDRTRGRSEVDLVIVGAGVVGLSYAVEASWRGLSVVVVDRDDRPVGASIRNFGYGSVSLRDDESPDAARALRSAWLDLGQVAGFRVSSPGTVVVARGEDELALLEELAQVRPSQVELLDAAAVEVRLGRCPPCIGGALLPLDLRIDPDSAVPALVTWLEGQRVDFLWGAAVQSIEAGRILVAGREITAEHVVVAVGHHLDLRYPQLAAVAGPTRRTTTMLRVSSARRRRAEPVVLTALAMPMHPAFRDSLRVSVVSGGLGRPTAEHAEGGSHLTLDRHPAGDLLLVETGTGTALPTTSRAPRPHRLPVEEAQALLGTDRLTVRQQWRGVHAPPPRDEEEMRSASAAGPGRVTIVAGMGVTTALGSARAFVDGILTRRHQTAGSVPA